MKHVTYIVLFLIVLVFHSWSFPLHKSLKLKVSDSIKLKLSCPLLKDVGRFSGDTNILVDCDLKNEDTSAIIIRFTSGYGFRVPQYTQLIEPGQIGKIKFHQAIREIGGFTKSWPFELSCGNKKETLIFYIKGERLK